VQGLRRRRGVNRGEIRDPTLSALRTGGRKGGAWKSGECVGREGVKGEGAQGGGVALRCNLRAAAAAAPTRQSMHSYAYAQPIFGCILGCLLLRVSDVSQVV
jgi:hypothetical protein